MKQRPLRYRRLRREALESKCLLAASDFLPLAGDFDADGLAETALYAPAQSRFFWRRENNPGFADMVVEVAGVGPGAMPIAGDFNGDGRDTLGLFDPASQSFRLLHSNESLADETHYSAAGFDSNYIALVGDWDGDGHDTPALWDTVSLRFYFAPDLAHALMEAPAFLPAWVEQSSGPSDWRPIAGDFNGDGRDSLGIVEQRTGVIFLQAELGHGGVQSALHLVSPAASATPLVGDFQGSGSEGLGFYMQDRGTFALKHQIAPGPFDTETYVVPLAGEGYPDNESSGRHREADAALRLEVIPWTSESDSPTTAGEVLAADVSGDGVVTLHDAFLIVSTLRTMHTGSPLEGEAGSRFDVNQDGIVSIFDALMIVQHLRRERSATSAVAKAVPVANAPSAASAPLAKAGSSGVLLASDVETLLNRAAAASASEDAIISIVDREGRILGVRVEQGVLDLYDANDNGMIDAGSAEEELLVFAIDGSLAKARTAAFFASGDGSGEVGPLTSRTVRFISQSTVTQRELESNPNIQDLDSTVRGPGFVAPAGLGGHFPPDVPNTPPVDLFGIEHQSRDSIVHAGTDGLKGTGDDLLLASRFNVDPVFIPMDQELEPPESYGFTSRRMEEAQSRGIATLPGGLPIYKFYDGKPTLVGGIGVFFPGPDGFATHEQGFVAGAGQKTIDRLNAPLVLEAEWIAYAALGGAPGAQAFYGVPGGVGTLDGIAPLPNVQLPIGRIDLVGIQLEIYGPHPTSQRPQLGFQTLLNVGQQVGQGDSTSGENQVVDPGPDLDPTTAVDNVFLREGEAVPGGWLVLPHDSMVDPITAAEVEQIIAAGIAEAELVRAAIRLPRGSRTSMVFAVADSTGEVLGLYRMPDATVFSIDVAVAKARNMAYFADASQVVDADRVDDNNDGVPDPNIPAGAAFSNRTFRFLSEPTFPDGVNEGPGGAYSILRNPSINPQTGENLGLPAPASSFDSVLGFDAFNPSRNMHNPNNLANQNGTVFFPGSTPLYKTLAGVPTLIGGLGVSGDGVDQDDVVTAAAQSGFDPPQGLRADVFFVRGVRLPYQKFLRNPYG